LSTVSPFEMTTEPQCIACAGAVSTSARTAAQRLSGRSRFWAARGVAAGRSIDRPYAESAPPANAAL
jgi:hypothetical protein